MDNISDKTGSILDRVISVKKTSEIEQFHPSDVVSSLLKHLTSREEDVQRRRFGLLGRDEETLEKIGLFYHVTRERIRQIESTAIRKLKQLKNFSELVKPIEETVSSVLEQHGGIMSEESLLKHLLQIAGDTSQNRHAVLFVLSQLLERSFRRITETKQYRSAWQLASSSFHLLDLTIEKLVHIISEIGKPVTFQNLIQRARADQFFQEHIQQLDDETILAYLDISQYISKNPYGEYGLIEWGSIIPRRMNDKIYLVLKKSGKPLHFSEITRIINEMKFDERKAHAPTVHNELILNKEYVLVGRGIYALKEWGYNPGVVADVIAGILRSSEKPLSREEIVERVMKQRMVKKNTVHLALTDHSLFQKNPDGTFQLHRATGS